MTGTNGMGLGYSRTSTGNQSPRRRPETTLEFGGLRGRPSCEPFRVAGAGSAEKCPSLGPARSAAKPASSAEKPPSAGETAWRLNFRRSPVVGFTRAFDALAVGAGSGPGRKFGSAHGKGEFRRKRCAPLKVGPMEGQVSEVRLGGPLFRAFDDFPCGGSRAPFGGCFHDRARADGRNSAGVVSRARKCRRGRLASGRRTMPADGTCRNGTQWAALRGETTSSRTWASRPEIPGRSFDEQAALNFGAGV